MACSRPNVMSYDSWHGYTFKGPRGQEKHIGERLGLDDKYFLQDIPCGKCDLCLVERRYERALRIMLEAEFWPEQSYFITLTYDNEHMDSFELNHDHWAQFIKDFRQKFCQAKYCNIRDRGTLREGKEYSTTFKKIKQVMSGEYGDTFGRRHFHGIIFNHSFRDIEPILDKEGQQVYSEKGFPLFKSESLFSVWKKGYVQIQEINMDMALYVGSYITDRGEEEEVSDLDFQKKQYGRFGRGIGFSWIQKWWSDVLAAGKVMLRDRDYPIPRMFHRWMSEVICPVQYKKWKNKKILKQLKERDLQIKKGDGPLRRSKAKGRIFASIKQKRSYDVPTRSRPFDEGP